MTRNPGKGSFARCVSEVSRRGGVDDPAAVCAAEKRKAGEALNPAGDDITDRAKRYRARAHPPEGEPRCFACGAPQAMDIHHVNGNESDESSDNKVWACRSCNVVIGNVMRSAGVGKLTRQYNPAGGATSLGAWMNAVTSLKGEGGNMSVPDAVAMVRATSQAQRSKFAKEIWRIRGRRGNPGNPADLAAEAFELFHGYPPKEEIVFESMEHDHEFYAGIGELIELVVVPQGERKGIRLHSFAGAQLAMNEKALRGEPIAQLFIVGGDQALGPDILRQFGIDPSKLHEQEVLGQCVDITYFTKKTHLGQDGGTADYIHAFGEESAKRQMRIVVSPTATYHTVNRVIGLWGGKYTIEPEGIRN